MIVIILEGRPQRELTVQNAIDFWKNIFTYNVVWKVAFGWSSQALLLWRAMTLKVFESMALSSGTTHMDSIVGKYLLRKQENYVAYFDLNTFFFKMICLDNVRSESAKIIFSVPLYEH